MSSHSLACVVSAELNPKMSPQHKSANAHNTRQGETFLFLFFLFWARCCSDICYEVDGVGAGQVVGGGGCERNGPG